MNEANKYESLHMGGKPGHVKLQELGETLGQAENIDCCVQEHKVFHSA